MHITEVEWLKPETSDETGNRSGGEKATVLPQFQYILEFLQKFIIKFDVLC